MWVLAKLGIQDLLHDPDVHVIPVRSLHALTFLRLLHGIVRGRKHANLLSEMGMDANEPAGLIY